MFFKRRLLKKESELYRGLYCFGKLILKKKISLNNKDQVSILKFRKTQKMAWFSNANPDLALTFQKSDVTLLNKKHTKREMLISLDSEDLAIKTIAFLENNFDLEYNVYSPDFS